MVERVRIDVDGAAALAAHTTRLLEAGHRLALVAAHHDQSAFRVVYLFTAGPPDRRTELVLRTGTTDPHIPSLAAISFPASRFEREMRDLYGIEPDNHPLPRPLVHHPHWPSGWHPMRADCAARPPMTAVEPFPFLTVDGEGVYEIPVGPVHAGLIEPGHFRFSVVGETILKVKTRLWYVHKGIEKLFHDKPISEGVHLAERISGDTAVGHNLAYCLAVEDALQIPVPAAAQRIRAALLELERLHNHVADIGALCNDVAYGIAHAHTQRLRETLLRLNEHTTGHRLLRGAIFPGGAQLRDAPSISAVRKIVADLHQIVDIALANTVVRDRFTGTAPLTRQHADDIGTLGYVARSSGLAIDARVAQPFTDWPTLQSIPIQTSGDVLARFQQRVDEIDASAAILADLVPGLPIGLVGQPDRAPQPTWAAGTGVVEGWRGTIVHRIETRPGATLTRLKIVDPSFLNWPALPIALADTIVPDFPLANKSFNLSYAGNDL
jgi:Ni,Fe-hydrogenase III large subunit/Ni,Fe-hydrogenase III component G